MRSDARRRKSSRTTIVAFDTVKLSRLLRDKAKLSQEQAEGLADALSATLQGDRVTESHLRAELGETKPEIVRWVAGLIGFQALPIIGAVVALVEAMR